MHARYQQHLSSVAIFLVILTAFLVGFQLNPSRSSLQRPAWAALTPPLRGPLDDSVSLKPVQLFQQAFMQVQRNYVEPIEKPEALTYAAIRGMLSELNDPYTRFMNPDEFKEFNSDNAGHFAGIGATLNMTEIPAVKVGQGEGTVAPIECPACGTVIADMKHYRVSIVEPLPNSPALKAGLLSGDFIMKVDKKPTDGLTVSEVADMIRGPEGTEVTLEVARKGAEKALTIVIKRAQIQVPAVESRVLEDKIGYLRIFSFNEKTVQETRAALLDFSKANVKGVMLDLRNNPGGLMTECIKVASMFLASDKNVIVSTKGRDGDTEAYPRIGSQICDVPVVVLVNKGSASASEILTGALKDYHRATIIGETTFGKALVQTVLPLGEREKPCAMAVTTAHYYTPSGFDLAKRGITPDTVIALDKGVTKLNESDNQAKKALSLLHEAIARAR